MGTTGDLSACFDHWSRFGANSTVLSIFYAYRDFVPASEDKISGLNEESVIITIASSTEMVQAAWSKEVREESDNGFYIEAQARDNVLFFR
ncbi:MAG: hypothetical protein Kow0065_19310 [Methylomicrobium sp.]